MDGLSSIRKIAQALLFLLGTSLVGVVGFSVIEGYELLDAIYMTAITMSTVGFGVIGELSPAGKMFMVFMIIISAGTFVYAITTLTTFVIEGEIRQVFNRYQVNQKVAKLEDHIIICGLGRNGREAAIELLHQGQEFVVIDKHQEVIEEFRSEVQDILAVLGDATHEEILERANIRSARGLVSSLSTDAENVYIALTAREMNPEMEIVARATSESSISKLKRAGANRVIVPNLIGGRKMANMLTRPALVEFVDLITGEGNPDLHLEEIVCRENTQLVGKTLAELNVRSKTGAVIVGYKRGDSRIELNPPAREPLAADDRLFLMGNDQQIEAFKEAFG
ncbi:MAG: potassium channel protein [Bacteroidota bacterium]